MYIFFICYNQQYLLAFLKCFSSWCSTGETPKSSISLQPIYQVRRKKIIFFYFLYDHLIVLIFFKNHSNCSEEDFSFQGRNSKDQGRESWHQPQRGLQRSSKECKQFNSPCKLFFYQYSHSQFCYSSPVGALPTHPFWTDAGSGTEEEQRQAAGNLPWKQNENLICASKLTCVSEQINAYLIMAFIESSSCCCFLSYFL